MAGAPAAWGGLAGDDPGSTSGGEPVDELVTRAEGWYRESREHSAKWREKAREDYAFVAGDQWASEDKDALREQLRPEVTFNRIGPVIDSVAGAEIANRQEVQYLPRRLGVSAVNEALTAAAKWMRDECDAEDEESDAFLDLIVCGMGWTETRLDYEDDPDGRVIIERVDPLEMYWDPMARKRNLSDARYVLRVREMARSDVEAVWPDIEIEGDGAAWAGEPERSEPHDATEARFYKNDQGGGRAGPADRLWVAHVQWWDREGYVRIGDDAAGQVLDLEPAEFERFKARADRLGLEFPSARLTRKVFRQAWLCGRTVLEEQRTLAPDAFSLQCLTGKRDRNHGTFYGLVRAMKDPQRWANKWLSQVMHILNGNSKGGAFVEEGALSDVREAQRDWSKPGALIRVKTGGLAKIREKESTQFPAGMERLMEFAVTSIRDVTGVNVELLGMAERDQPGVLEGMRKQAGMTILAGLFDSLKLYRKRQGRVLLHVIQDYLSDGRLIRIEGPDVRQYLPLIRDPEVCEYDVIVDEATTSPNQKERVFGILMQLLPGLERMGVPIPPDVLDYIDLPASLVAKLKKGATAPKPPPPGAQLDQARSGAVMARAQADTVRAQADMARARVDLAKHASGGALETERALAEIAATKAGAMADLARAGATMMDSRTTALSGVVDALETGHGMALASRAAQSPPQPAAPTPPGPMAGCGTSC